MPVYTRRPLDIEDMRDNDIALDEVDYRWVSLFISDALSDIKRLLMSLFAFDERHWGTYDIFAKQAHWRQNIYRLTFSFTFMIYFISLVRQDREYCRDDEAEYENYGYY